MKAIPYVDQKTYELAKGYLSTLDIIGVNETLIEKYMNPLSFNPKPTSKEELYQRLLGSAQTAHMKAGVIGRSIGGVGKLAPIFYGFDPKAVVANYGDDWKRFSIGSWKNSNRMAKFAGHQEAFGHFTAEQFSRRPGSLINLNRPRSSSSGLTSSIGMKRHVQVYRCSWTAK